MYKISHYLLNKSKLLVLHSFSADSVTYSFLILKFIVVKLSALNQHVFFRAMKHQLYNLHAVLSINVELINCLRHKSKQSNLSSTKSLHGTVVSICFIPINCNNCKLHAHQLYTSSFCLSFLSTLCYTSDSSLVDYCIILNKMLRRVYRYVTLLRLA